MFSQTLMKFFILLLYLLELINLTDKTNTKKRITKIITKQKEVNAQVHIILSLIYVK